MLSIYDWFGYDVSLEERYRLIKQAGFDGVLLWWSDGFGRGKGYREGVRLSRNAGLLIENIHTPVQMQNCLSQDNLEGEALRDCYVQCIRDCSDFDIPTMVVHLPEDEYPLNERGMNRIKQITEAAEHYGVNVAMENLFNIHNLSCVLDSVSSGRVGFCYDSCHHANNKKAGDLLRKYGDRLMALHLHDNGGARKQHQLPFDGTIDFVSVMKEIAQTGYTGPTALEPMNWSYEELAMPVFLSRAYEKAKMLEKLRGSE